ncbi:MAG: UDP-N-acetylglucosamine pyrophosphorylase [Eubacterium sp.]|nr:UDP-N-acetylglucosamine pyrophosphorylase [Eubacterium sp.]
MDKKMRIRALETTHLLDLRHTIAGNLFADKRYPFEALSEIHDFILDMGNNHLSPARFEKRGEDIWIAKNATVAETAVLNGPLIIDEEAEIRHCAYIRGNVIVGKRAVVGNSTELKNSVLFDGVQVPHYNYVGDSILGFMAHMGAGSITSNFKSDGSLIEVHYGKQRLRTEMRKFGAVLGDYAEIGCGAVLNPGSMVGRDSMVYPLSSVRGYVPNQSIMKSQGKESIISKQAR